MVGSPAASWRNGSPSARPHSPMTTAELQKYGRWADPDEMCASGGLKHSVLREFCIDALRDGAVSRPGPSDLLRDIAVRGGGHVYVSLSQRTEAIHYRLCSCLAPDWPVTSNRWYTDQRLLFLQWTSTRTFDAIISSPLSIRGFKKPNWCVHLCLNENQEKN